jgi:hypothetical protein
MKPFGNRPTMLRFEGDGLENQQVERSLGQFESFGRHHSPFRSDTRA